MTKVTILGQAEVAEPEKKKIEFKFVLLTGKEPMLSNTPCTPSSFTNIILLNSAGFFDVMYAYSDTPDNGCVYLGHFNDGLV